VLSGSDNDYTEDFCLYGADGVKIDSDTEVAPGTVVYATLDKILIGSDNEVGSPAYCSDGKYNIYLFSGSNIEFGSNNYFRGAQMGANGALKPGTDIPGVEDVHVAAGWTQILATWNSPLARNLSG
jgi:hypothetical protein